MISSGTHSEVHLGIVTDNNDPEQRGRVKVRCDTLAGIGTELPDYIEPTFPFLASSDGQFVTGGWFFVPDVGVLVEIEVNTTSPRDETFAMISIEAPSYRWRHCRLSYADSIAEEFKGENYPLRRGITTAAGHMLVFDDTSETTEVKLLQQIRAGEFSFLDFDKNGSFLVLTSEGMMLFMNQEDSQLSLVDVNSNALVMTEAGWYITSGSTDMIQGGNGVMSLFTSNMLIKANGVSVNQAGLDTPVLVEGTAGFSTLLSAALAEIATGLLLIPASATATLALQAAVDLGSFTSTRLKAE